MMSNLDEEKNIYRSELDQWIKTLGLPQHQPDNIEIETILEFTRESLRERSSVDLSEDVIMLAQYALFLQQKSNECQTFLKWSSQVMNRLLGEDRPKLVRWVRQAELRKERIAYLARKMELICQNISGLVRARYNEGRNQ
jgi:hypothetical protein